MEIVPPVRTSVGLVGMLICFDVSIAAGVTVLHVNAPASFDFQKSLSP
jgi:hypothetical protein